MFYFIDLSYKIYENMGNKVTESIEYLYESAMVLAGVGDAMGYHNGNWEFCFQGEEIHKQLFAMGGISNLKIDKTNFRVSDDTVLLLSTAEALINVQKHKNDMNKIFSELAFRYQKDFVNDMAGRAGGMTTSSSIHKLKPLQEKGWEIPFNVRGGGCGAAMRSMCIGLRYPNIYKSEHLDNLIKVSVESSRMTHSHPTGFLGGFASALFAAFSICKVPLEKWGFLLLRLLPKVLEYVKSAGRDVKENEEHWSYFTEKWTNYLKVREILSGESKPVFPLNYGVKERDEFYKSLAFSNWGGSSGHDAPMISYDALLAAHDDWGKLCLHGMLHGGDNDSTGVIAGFCYGAMYGRKNVPVKNWNHLEYKDRLIISGRKLFDLAKCEVNFEEVSLYSEDMLQSLVKNL